MRIQTRLTAAILIIAMLPLFGLGAYLYRSYHADLTAAAIDHLESVAAIQQSRLTAVMGQNRERLALVASRTQLRISLDRFLRDGDPAARERMNRILADAVSSIDDLTSITVYGHAGVAIASTDAEVIGSRLPEMSRLERASTEPVVDHLYLDPDGGQRVILAGPMILEGRRLGVVVIRSRVDNLLASIGDYSGLGETGETVLARALPGDDYVFLAPTRFLPHAALQARSNLIDGAVTPSALFTAGIHIGNPDYRGRPVIAIARPVPGTDWLLAVKIDRDEAERELRSTTRTALVMSLMVAMLVVVGALAFARSISAPIVELASATDAVAEGDYGRQVAVTTTGEIGVLERGFNTMSDHVAKARADLEAKVDQLNREIAERRAVEAERERLIAELQQAMADIKTLEGIIPICASCKKIRDDHGYWQQLEAYLIDHSDARFSHGICPDCLKQYDLGDDA
jgi:HAMP domain-containing protein